MTIAVAGASLLQVDSGAFSSGRIYAQGPQP
jgi:hypothetical protein